MHSVKELTPYMLCSGTYFAYPPAMHPSCVLAVRRARIQTDFNPVAWFCQSLVTNLKDAYAA